MPPVIWGPLAQTARSDAGDTRTAFDGACRRWRFSLVEITFEISRFVVGGLTFPTEGCWEIVAQSGASVLRFVIYIHAVHVSS